MKAQATPLATRLSVLGSLVLSLIALPSSGHALGPAPSQAAQANSTPPAEASRYRAPDNFETLVAGRIYHGARPIGLREYRTLRDHYHIRTIIDLRGIFGEQLLIPDARQWAESMGMRYLYEGLTVYDMDSAYDAQVARILGEISDCRNQPVYFHCRLGDDRTMIISALYQNYYLGRTTEEIDARLRRHHFGTFLGGIFLSSVRRYVKRRLVPQGERRPVCTDGMSMPTIELPERPPASAVTRWVVPSAS